MKFYKLELINREQSYNQMFGTTPNVGVLNPVSAAKVGATGAKQMTVAPGKSNMNVGMGIGGVGVSGGAPPTAAVNQKQGGAPKSRLVN